MFCSTLIYFSLAETYLMSCKLAAAHIPTCWHGNVTPVPARLSLRGQTFSVYLHPRVSARAEKLNTMRSTVRLRCVYEYSFLLFLIWL